MIIIITNFNYNGYNIFFKVKYFINININFINNFLLL